MSRVTPQKPSIVESTGHIKYIHGFYTSKILTLQTAHLTPFSLYSVVFLLSKSTHRRKNTQRKNNKEANQCRFMIVSWFCDTKPSGPLAQWRSHRGHSGVTHCVFPPWCYPLCLPTMFLNPPTLLLRCRDLLRPQGARELTASRVWSNRQGCALITRSRLLWSPGD